MGVDHYENFPVASLLCPPALRPAIAAIYWFARTADDIADEGSAPASERRADLSQMGHDLDVCLGAGASVTSARWPGVFSALQRAHQRHHFPLPLLHDLLSAFAQDVGNPVYPDRAALLDYCRRSANPIGRLLLHLYGMNDAPDLARSDAICSALQLINFWQDLSIDLPRGRNYLPSSDLAAQGLPAVPTGDAAERPALKTVLRSLCDWAWQLMHEGAPLALRVPGRAGWELRLVVQGGWRVLEHIRSLDHDTLATRPTLGRRDVPLLLWRAWRRPTGAAA